MAEYVRQTLIIADAVLDLLESAHLDQFDKLRVLKAAEAALSEYALKKDVAKTKGDVFRNLVPKADVKNA